ncbi:MAG: hypothetical protein M5U26_09990 [Planctomycetota bacterium]|nr:hypothetical protein [Planctomycetota bacterium]
MSSSPRFHRYLDKAPLVVAFAWMGFAAPHAYAQAIPIPVTTVADTVAVDPANSPLDAGTEISLRSAIQFVNAQTGTTSYEVLLDSTLGGGVYTLSIAGALEDAAATGDLDITRAVPFAIRGTNGIATIDAEGIDRVFHILASGGSVTFQNLLIQDGRAADSGSAGLDAYGGGIFQPNPGALVLDQVSITNCLADGGTPTTAGLNGGNALGGGLYVSGGTLDIQNGSFVAGCQAVGGNGANGTTSGIAGGDGGLAQGGGIWAFDTVVSVDGSGVENNRARGGQGGNGGTSADGGNGGAAEGGGLFVDTGSVSIDGSSLSTNDVTGGNGGMGASHYPALRMPATAAKAGMPSAADFTPRSPSCWMAAA